MNNTTDIKHLRKKLHIAGNNTCCIFLPFIACVFIAIACDYSICEKIVGKEGGYTDDKTQALFKERTDKLCPINDTKFVYEYHSSKKCEFENDDDLCYESGVFFAVAVFLFVAFAICVSEYVTIWLGCRKLREIIPILQQNMEINNNTCAICLSALYLCDKSNPMKVFANEDIKRLDCDHLYHTRCIEQWLDKNEICPLCRNRLTV
jgi:hypothetical protein